MTDKLNPVRCGCGGLAEVAYKESGLAYVICLQCLTETRVFRTEVEAITTWNRAMSGNAQERAENARCNERTAKVIKHKYWLGVSLNVVREQNIGYEWLCENCKKMVLEGDEYCSHCGSRLIWGDDNE